MSGSARLLLATLAPWEPMCRRCQENGGLGPDNHRFRKGKEPSRGEYIGVTPVSRIASEGARFQHVLIGHVTNSILASRITFPVSNVIIGNATWNRMPVWNELLTLTFSIFQLYKRNMLIIISGYGSIPINTIFNGMNIHLPAILGFTRYQGFDPSPYLVIHLSIPMQQPGGERTQEQLQPVGFRDVSQHFFVFYLQT